MNLRINEGYNTQILSNYWEMMKQNSSGAKVFADYSLTLEWGDSFKEEKFVTKIARYTFLEGAKEIGLFQGVVKGNKLYHYMISGYTSGSGISVLPGYGEIVSEAVSEIIKQERVKDYNIYSDYKINANDKVSEGYYTYYIDLNNSMNAILSNMEKNTRRLLTRSLKGGVEAVVSTSVDSLRDSYDLLKSHSREKGYKIPSFEWYLSMADRFNKIGDFISVTARKDGDLLATCVCLGYDHKMNFINCANTIAGNSLGANRLCHYALFEWAKNHDYSVCDLGGTDEVKLPGIDSFKRSFGGYRVERNLLSSSNKAISFIVSHLDNLSNWFEG